LTKVVDTNIIMSTEPFRLAHMAKKNIYVMKILDLQMCYIWT